KEASLLLGRQANAGVANLESQPGAIAELLALCRQRHGALLRELARVAQQIEQYLAKFRQIGVHDADLRVAEQLDTVAVLLGERLHHSRDVTDYLRDAEVLEVQLHLAGFD